MPTGQQSEGERSGDDLSGASKKGAGSTNTKDMPVSVVPRGLPNQLAVLNYKQSGVTAETSRCSRKTPISTCQQRECERSSDDLSGASNKAAGTTNTKSMPASVVPGRQPNQLALLNNSTSGMSREAPMSTGQRSEGKRSSGHLSRASKKSTGSSGPESMNAKSIPACVVPRGLSSLLAVLTYKERLLLRSAIQSRNEAAFFLANHGGNPKLAKKVAPFQQQYELDSLTIELSKIAAAYRMKRLLRRAL